ncbi:hypothetical protein [Propioniciclava flava]
MDILGRNSTTKDYLRPAEQAVATAILADPDAASAATVASLAREAKVSQASVVRLAHSLGFSRIPRPSGLLDPGTHAAHARA